MIIKIALVQWLGNNSDTRVTIVKVHTGAIFSKFFDYTDVLSIVPDPLDNVG